MFVPVYLDHNATTPLNPRVLEGMRPYLEMHYGNPSSRHEYGRAARRAIDESRQRVAHAVGAHPTEVVFTSGGSEASNLFIKGAAACLAPGRLAISAIEHPSVREPARQLVRAGWKLREIAVDENCRVASADFHSVLAEKPAILSVMLVNNETGAVQDVNALALQASPARAWFHVDAVQAFGKLPLDFRSLNRNGIHALTLSAHKLGGPKGAGALVVDKRVEMQPLIAGGGHERGLRSGTENVAAIVGFGLAAELAAAGMEERTRHLVSLRTSLETGLAELGATIFAAATERVPNTCYFAIPGLDGETLVGRLDRAGFAVAAGAACSSAHPEPSQVLLAMGIDQRLARGSVRVSLGESNTASQVRDFLAAMQTTITQFQGLAALTS